MIEDKYIGLALAISSSAAIGTSFIVTKKGLNDAADRAPTTTNNATDGHLYLRNPLWWAGTSLMVLGEVANFAAYSFAPPILVTPLGFLSVLIGAILASFFLNESLGHIGRLGCSLCILGAIIIVAHAPADRDIHTVDEILQLALQPGFLLYCFTAVVTTLLMIYKFAPKYGRKSPLIYMTICSLMGSLTVMSSKGFGIAIKLTLGGHNQFGYLSTYVFMLVCIICILLQMNYFNKALDTFSTNVVNPIYYVSFTTATIIASTILFQGFNTTDPVNTVSLIAGFLITFIGVHLLNTSIGSDDSEYLQLNGSSADFTNQNWESQGHPHLPLENGLMTPRVSLTGRLSDENWRGHSRTRSGSGSQYNFRGTHGRRGSLTRGEVIFHTDEEREIGSVPPTGKLNTLQEEAEMFPEGEDGWPRGSVEGDGDATELTRINGKSTRKSMLPASVASEPPQSRAGHTPR